MPEEESSQAPSGRPESQPPAPVPNAPLVVQGVVPESGKFNADQSRQNSTKPAEKLHPIHHGTFWLQVGLGGIGLMALWIYHGQLTAMQGQLEEMKRSGEQSTQQAWSAIGNLNWMARSMDLSQKQSQKALDASIAALQQEQRPWVSFSGVRESLAEKAELAGSEIVNTGKTPARDITVAIGFFTYTGNVSFADREAKWMEKMLTQSPIWNDEPRIDQQLTSDRQLADSYRHFLSAPLPPPPQQAIRFTYAPDLAPKDIVGRSIIAPSKSKVGVLSPNDHYPIPILAISSSYEKINSQQALVSFGRISYTDIFNKKRLTTFCNIRPAGGRGFAPCPVYNIMR